MLLEYVPRNSPPSLFDQRERHWMQWAGEAAVNVSG
jgi:hypothetical protein